MSHFTVLVKVTADRLEEHNGDIKEAIDAMLAPYQENNMGDCPQEFLEFHDKTEEIEESAREVITADSYYGKNHPETVSKTLLEAYGDFDHLAEDYHGYNKDEGTGKYGYWENPNRKWDWYQVGGRWSGLLRVKEMAETAERGEHSLLDDDPVDEPHTADVASVADIDFEGLDLEVDIKIEEFWGKYQRLQRIKAGEEAGEKDDWWEYDLYSTLIDLGLRKVVKEGERDPKTREWITKPEYEDIPFTLEDLKANHRWHWEFGTWAVLDDDGWHEKGNMGWWGMHDATPDDEKNWSKSYVDTFLKHEKPDTRLAIVDCHI